MIFDTERKSSVILEATRLVDPSMPLETFKKITYSVLKKLAAAKGNVVKEVESKVGQPNRRKCCKSVFSKIFLVF
ncbi:hypothetical protein HanPI659440_Chr06g0235831 [Helianthus annuus]|nr:hypothetical protein HanPI659440_Chr17g0687451 [Helianthus annuus]KAJ0780278.1 hypothetical protein HanPI659440_Chr06g0235831 [Helianthus annuus]